MAYQYLILHDPEEGWQINHENIFFANNKEQIERQIRNAASKNNYATICVYELNTLVKIKDQPTYQRYKVKDGEIIPV